MNNIQSKLDGGYIDEDEYLEQVEAAEAVAKRRAEEAVEEIQSKMNFVIEEEERVAKLKEQGKKKLSDAMSRIKIIAKVKDLTGRWVDVSLDASNTVEDLSKQIEEQLGVEASRQNVVHNGQALQNKSLRLFDCKINDGDVLVLGRQPSQPRSGVYVCMKEVQGTSSADNSQVANIGSSAAHAGCCVAL